MVSEMIFYQRRLLHSQYSGRILKSVASELGLPEGIPVSYRAGDQPNNALSLNVLNPGEVAATAGTSGVIYGVTDKKKYDPLFKGKYFSACKSYINHKHVLEYCYA